MQELEPNRREGLLQSANAGGGECVAWSPGAADPVGDEASMLKTALAEAPLRISCLRSERELEALEPQWELLDKQQSPRTPFTSPAWNLMWWKHLRARGLLAQDSLCVFAIHDSAGLLVAVAPMLTTSRPAKGALRIRELRFFGADANITELRGLVCAPRDYDRSLAAILQVAATSGREWHLVSWSGLRRPPDEWNAAGYPSLVWRRQITDFCLKLPASWSVFRGNLPRNVRESIRKCYNSLKRDGHVFELRIVSKPEGISAALDILFRLHRARSKAVGTIEHADVFRDGRTRRFLRDYVGYSAARGEMRIFQLLVGGTVVATRVGFLLDRDLYLYYSGYDPAWARYSVMTTGVIEILKWAILNDVDLVNLSTGDDESKTRWRPTRIAYHDAAQRSGTPAWQTGLAAGEAIFLGLRSGQRSVRRWVAGARARLLPRS